MELGPNWYEIGSKTYPGEQNGFHTEGDLEHEKVLLFAMVSRQERFFNSRCSRMAETLSFFPLLLFFLFASQKVGAHTTRPRHSPPLPVSPALIIYQKDSMELNFEGFEIRK